MSLALVRIVTRADDAGMAVAANRGIENAVKHGLAKNISYMAPGPAIEDAANRLKDLPVDHGFHFTLNAEWKSPRWKPVAGQLPSLTESSGFFYPATQKLELAAPEIREVEKEIRAQYEKLVSLGIPISYVDEHMGVGHIAGIGEHLAEFAEEKDLIFRPTIPPLPNKHGCMGDHPERVLCCLEDLQEGTYLLIAHPALAEGDMLQIRRFEHDADERSVAEDRKMQGKIFTDASIADLFKQMDYKAIRYSEI